MMLSALSYRKSRHKYHESRDENNMTVKFEWVELRQYIPLNVSIPCKYNLFFGKLRGDSLWISVCSSILPW